MNFELATAAEIARYCTAERVPEAEANPTQSECFFSLPHPRCYQDRQLVIIQVGGKCIRHEGDIGNFLCLLSLQGGLIFEVIRVPSHWKPGQGLFSNLIG